MPRHSPHEAFRANLSPFARCIEHRDPNQLAERLKSPLFRSTQPPESRRSCRFRQADSLGLAFETAPANVAFLYPDKGARPPTTKRGARMTRTPLVSRIVTGESPPGAPYIILFLRRFLST